MVSHTTVRQTELIGFLKQLNPGSACFPWPWQTSGGKFNYGRVVVGGHRMQAHRWVYEQINGPVASNLEICHHCDNPPCVRPDHLFVGTRVDNMHDASIKGRMRGNRTHHASGETHYKAKLTDAQIDDLRRRYITGEYTTRQLADLFDINQAQVWRLLHGKGRTAPSAEEALAIRSVLVKRAALGRGPDRAKRHRRWLRKPE